MKYISKIIDNVKFDLKQDFDFSWLNEYGKIFCVFDQQDSGNICFGVEQEDRKLFIKYAGAPTINYDGKCEDAILRMKNAVHIYKDIYHQNLIKLVDNFEKGEGYVTIYEWEDGECLNAHWNFDKYPKYTHSKSPNFKFNHLDLDLKLKCLDDIFNLHKLVAKKGYVAIDFYDGSIMYDFKRNKTTICDIDFYKKSPFINNMGQMWGSSRFMSPEEFKLGATIDEITNVFTMGAIAFELLGSNYNRSFEKWTASEDLFYVAKKAINYNRNERYKSISKFYNEWKNNIK